MRMYPKKSEKPPLLTAEEEIELAKEWRGDEEAKRRLCEANLIAGSEHCKTIC